MPILDPKTMKLPTLVELKAALDSFAASPATFRVLHTVPSISAGGTRGKPNRLYVLDSSYNPPTRAHLRIAISALTEDDAAAKGGPRSLLLLLATQNADKGNVSLPSLLSPAQEPTKV